MRIGLLLCDHVSAELMGISGDYLAMFRKLFADRPGLEIVAYDAVNGEIPNGPGECDAWLTTGSRFSVNDDEAWIRRLERFVRQVAVAQVPFVGVCFGHQLLAKALGGTVVTSERGWGVGIEEVNVASGLAFMPDGIESFRVMNSHAEQIEELPNSAVVIGWNDHCPVSMMSLGSSLLGIQGHPEMDVDYSKSLIRSRRGTRIPREIADEAIASLAEGSDSRLVADFIAEFLARAIRS
jgi:GMP synthase (glutamine-hydrolysing)